MNVTVVTNCSKSGLHVLFVLGWNVDIVYFAILYTNSYSLIQQDLMTLVRQQAKTNEQQTAINGVSLITFFNKQFSMPT